MTPISRAGLLREAEEQAYVLLEECRIRVEQISPPGPSDVDLHELHRHLGLAGYYSSTMILGEVRERCLARARALATDPGTGDLRGTLDTRIARALEDVRDGLDAGSLGEGDHLHLAQAHAAAARVGLRGPALDRGIETVS